MKFDILQITVDTLKDLKKFYKRHKPRIFMVGGIACSAAGTVTACMATYNHIDDILDTCKANLEAAEELPEEEVGKEKLKVIAGTIGQMAKTYAIPAALSTAGYAGIIYANHIQEQRQAVLSEALTSVGAAYAAYKKRIEERFGKENAEAALLNANDAEITVDNGDGKKPKKEKVEMVESENLAEVDPFSFFFDATSRNWTTNAEYNKSFLILMERECNHILRMEGSLMLSEVLKKLDLPVTKASLVAGWVKDNEEISDNYVDFGLSDIRNAATRRFVNGIEDVVLLRMNCSANVSDYI